MAQSRLGDKSSELSFFTSFSDRTHDNRMKYGLLVTASTSLSTGTMTETPNECLSWIEGVFMSLCKMLMNVLQMNLSHDGGSC